MTTEPQQAVTLTLTNGEEVTVTPGVLDGAAERLYLHSDCTLLAIALTDRIARTTATANPQVGIVFHVETGLPLHVLAVDPASDLLVDVLGHHQGQEVADQYGKTFGLVDITYVPVSTFRNEVLFSDNGNRFWLAQGIAPLVADRYHVGEVVNHSAPSSA